MRLLGQFFSLFTGLVILLAFGGGALLLIKDTPLSLLQHLAHAPISAIPLLLIGLAFLCFQLVIRPTPLDLFKACLISTAFLLWGFDQLLPTGWQATTLGDIVIVLYVLDLGWMMGDHLKQRHKLVQQATQPLPVQPAHSLHLLPSLPDAHPPLSLFLSRTCPDGEGKRSQDLPVSSERKPALLPCSNGIVCYRFVVLIVDEQMTVMVVTFEYLAGVAQQLPTE